jgi:hypothetical protein
MRRYDYIVLYLLALVIQMVITNYFHLTPFISLSILPVMVLCIPLSRSTINAMIIAFATGLALDVLAEGSYGLNTVAILPIAACRKLIVSMIFGKDHIVRDEDFSIRKNGLGKVGLAIVLAQAVFLFIYISADGAGMRPFWFNAARFGASLTVNSLVSLTAATVLTPDDRR